MLEHEEIRLGHSFFSVCLSSLQHMCEYEYSQVFLNCFNDTEWFCDHPL